MKRLLSTILSVGVFLSCLSVSASAAGSLPFEDINTDHWAYERIQYVYENGLMNGTGPTTFSPNEPFSRAMFVTMLGRLEGIDPDSYPGTNFQDVPAGSWLNRLLLMTLIA